MADMDGISEIEMLGHGCNVGGVVIHVMTIADLSRTAMAAPVMGDHTTPLADEIEHLSVPVIGTQWPSVVEDDRLGIPGSPVLVKDLDPILGGDCTRGVVPSSEWNNLRQFGCGCRRA
jgi:hypothetical protein